MKFNIRSKKIFNKLLTLTAALVLSLAVVCAKRNVFVAADDETVPLPNNVMSAQLGQYTFYRWTQVTQSNMPTDDQEHLSLLVSVSEGDGKIPYCMILNGVAPADIWLGPSAPSVPTVPESQRCSKDFLSQWLAEKDHEWEESAYIHTTSTIHLNASQVDFGKQVFFTDSDLNAPYIKFKGFDVDRKDSGGGQSRSYQIRLKSDNSHTYHIVGNNDKDGRMDVVVDNANARPWTFQGKDNNEWEIYTRETGGYDDECLEIQANWGLAYIEDGDHDGDNFKWWIGEEMHFAGIQEEELVVPKGVVCPIGASEIVDAATNKSKKMSGTVLPKGKKITVKNGGILSIEGQLINNGTITVEAGGTVLVKNGGSIAPFMPEGTPSADGCGAIRCSGDMIIQKGGAVFGGIGTGEAFVSTEFNLDSGATLINQGLLVYGGLRLCSGARMELYPESVTHGGWFITPYVIQNTPFSVLASTAIYSDPNLDRNNYRAVLNWVRTLTPDYSDKLFFELKTEPSSDQLGSTQVYHVGSSIDSVKMTDLLSKLIPVFQQKTVTGAPASANAVNPIQLFGFNSSSSMDLNEIDRSALDKMPYGLYLADSVRIVPIIKISDSAVLDDAFFKNQSVRYVDLTL